MNRIDFIMEDVLEFLELQGCASTRKFYYHLGFANPQLYDRRIALWKSQLSSECDIHEPDTATLVKDLRS